MGGWQLGFLVYFAGSCVLEMAIYLSKMDASAIQT